ncbi:MAG TPA: protease, partial [Saprospiraceae bacterium]|nr:protease [Saprospiraceae bacterium]
MNTRLSLFATTALLIVMGIEGFSQETRLLRQATISANHIAFVYAGDVWTAELDGKNPRRLTTHPGTEGNPYFSPDGKWIAFSAEYDGNNDVFVAPVEGGEPRRLTWHPQADIAKGWTPDGKHVLFASGRENAPYPSPDRFWKVSPDGKGLEQALPIPRVWEGSFSPDGKRFAYQMIMPWENEFRNYRGGQNNPIRIIDLANFEQITLPFDGANDREPQWVGDEIFFLSDRDFAMNIWSYNLNTKQLKQVTKFRDFDCKSLRSGAGKLIFENGGRLYTLDAKGGEPKKLTITVEGDFPWARPHWEKVGAGIAEYSLSPGGKRVLMSSRGDVFSVPAEKGDIRNLTTSSGVADRSPACSPDGEKIAYFSDESGEYQLFIADAFGKVQKKIALANPTYYYTPVWSPDSKYLGFGDADRNLWYLDIATGKATLVDNEGSAHPERNIAPAWSPDSKWIAYSKRLGNEFNTIFVYSLEQKKAMQFTDGMSNCKAPVWDKSGKYLYFLSSTDFALGVGWLDLSSYSRVSTQNVYVAVLSKKEASPLKPLSDEEEKPDTTKKDTAKIKVNIDFDGLG